MSCWLLFAIFIVMKFQYNPIIEWVWEKFHKYFDVNKKTNFLLLYIVEIEFVSYF